MRRSFSDGKITPSLVVLGFVLIILQYQNCAPDQGPSAFNLGSTGTSSQYSQTILGDMPSYYWMLNETTGTTFQDSSGNNNIAIAAGPVTLGVPSYNSQAMGGTAVGLSGGNSYISTETNITAPTVFSMELWFKTTQAGGKLLGFGNAQTGASTTFDRQLYMSNTGQIYFGVYGGSDDTINSNQSLADGNWHYVVATFSSSVGAFLFIDGTQVASAPPVTLTAYSGYWRIGYDAVTGWPGAPTTANFIGDLGEVAIYGAALSAQQVTTHFNSAR